MQHHFVLIGHGNISKSYLKAFAKFAEQGRAEIVGVVGRSAEKAASFAAAHGIACSGTDLAEVAVRAQATAAVVCTPNAVHYDGVMGAARLGLHVLCEKPLHIAPDKQLAMIASCKQHGVKLGVSYMRRFIPHIQYMKELLDSGKLGKVTVADVTIKHYRPKKYYDSWHGTYEIDGGGPFIQQGSHIVDMVQWLCGGYREVLEAKRFQVCHVIETEDHGYAVIRYRNGAVGMIEASTACTGIEQERIEISGTLGSITANYKEIVTFEVPGAERPQFPVGDAHNDALFVKLIEDFLAAVETGRAPAIDGESAAATTELIHDIYAKSGTPLRLL